MISNDTLCCLFIVVAHIVSAECLTQKTKTAQPNAQYL